MHTDSGPEFRNKEFENFCKNNNIKKIFGRAYYPQTQGCVESYNKEIKDLLFNKYCEKNFLFICSIKKWKHGRLLLLRKSSIIF